MTNTFLTLAESGDGLSAPQSEALMEEILLGRMVTEDIVRLLTALNQRPVRVEQLASFARVMRRHAAAVFAAGEPVLAHLVDTCGTGGDRAGTFNISTAAAIVAAGAGIPVGKHGNRAASSRGGRAGVADAREPRGAYITPAAGGVRRCIDVAVIGFCFAPTFHPAMRHAGPARRELGVRTVFNVLGPLANPGRVRRQALGVGAPALAPLMIRVLQDLGHERALVFYGEDGLDELTTTGPSRVFELKAGKVTDYELEPKDLGLGRSRPEDLRGGTPAENAGLLRQVLDGEVGPRREVVVLNAAAAILAAGKADDWGQAGAAAREALDSGRAKQALSRLVETSKTPSGQSA